MQASTGWSDEKFYLFYHMINYVKFLNFFNEVFICPKLRTTLFFRLDRNCKKIAWAQKQHEHRTKILGAEDSLISHFSGQEERLCKCSLHRSWEAKCLLITRSNRNIATWCSQQTITCINWLDVIAFASRIFEYHGWQTGQSLLGVTGHPVTHP